MISLAGRVTTSYETETVSHAGVQFLTVSGTSCQILAHPRKYTAEAFALSCFSFLAILGFFLGLVSLNTASFI